LDLFTKKTLIKGGDMKLTIKDQCRLLGLNRSSYYYQELELSVDDQAILNRMDEIFTEHPYYGTRRMMHVLKNEDIDIGRKKVRRFYLLLGIETIYPKKNISKRNQAHKVYPYLLKDFAIVKPNQVWSMDITYIRLKQGFVYLAAIIDWYSRFVLSWRVSISLEADFCVEALQGALDLYPKPEIFNTDQGVQFTSSNFINVLKNDDIKISMDGKGRALDNVFIERFWRSLKQEKIYLIDLLSVKDAKRAIGDYMQFYNYNRLHQSLNYHTPVSIHFKSELQMMNQNKQELNDGILLPSQYIPSDQQQSFNTGF
jgi:putative transposase